MPRGTELRSERVIAVFVSSPSGLEAERERLEEIVTELNLTWSRKFNARFELIMWETHGFPGIGEDPQEVLNQELPDDYDLYIGMMWGRFGTPTGRAASGTQEEYLHAVQRFQSDPKRTKVMFYFKDAPIPPSLIDPAQLQKVQEFKQSLGEEGTLYWGFGQLDDFGPLLRLHLSRQLQDFTRGTIEDTLSNSGLDGEQKSQDEWDDELGLLELQDLFGETIRETVEISQRVTSEWLKFGERVTERNKEIHKITAAIQSAKGTLDRRRAKALIDGLAAEMRRFVERVKPDLPRLRELSRKAAEAMSRGILIESEMYARARMTPEYKAGAQEILTGLGQLIERLQGLHDAIASRRSELSRLPRLTTEMNRARRELGETLDAIMAGTLEGKSLYIETEKSLRATLDGQDSKAQDEGPRVP
jgi:hypothetical protein